MVAAMAMTTKLDDDESEKATTAIAAAGAIEVAATAAKRREQSQLRDTILAEIPEEHRAKFMEVCVRSIPSNVYFLDGMVLVSVLTKIGYADLGDPRLKRIEFTSMGYGVGWCCAIDDGDEIGRAHV